MRPTSWESYKRLEESGNLSKRRLEVLRFVYYHPGCTPMECTEHYVSGMSPEDAVKVDYTPIFSQLKHRGMLEEVGVREYKGRRRITYDVTGLLEPNPIVKQVAKKEHTLGILSSALRVISETECADCKHLANIARVALFQAGY